METEYTDRIEAELKDIKSELHSIKNIVSTTDRRIQLMASSRLDEILDQTDLDEDTKEITRRILNGTYNAKEIGD